MEKRLKLSARLMALAELVTEGNRLADVGCDHAYLPVYLVRSGKIPGAIALDVRTGPLKKAKEHICEYELEPYIETRLGDGLSALAPGEADTLVIAGMGGPLMERILIEGAAVRDSFRELILQPQSDLLHFRQFLFVNGICVTDERIVQEDGKFYPMMRAVPGKTPQEKWSGEELMFGRFLLRERNPVLRVYLDRELCIREKILENLKNGGSASRERKNEIKTERRLILSALKRYEGREDV